MTSQQLAALFHEFITTRSELSRNAVADYLEELGAEEQAEQVRNVFVWYVTVRCELDILRIVRKLTCDKTSLFGKVVKSVAESSLIKFVDFPLFVRCVCLESSIEDICYSINIEDTKRK